MKLYILKELKQNKILTKIDKLKNNYIVLTEVLTYS